MNNDSIYIEPFKSIRAGNNYYRNLQFLGKGGNGTAFLVSCTGGQYKGEIFAMKVFHKISSIERRTRFLNEVKFMKEQYHPSIMRQYDEGTYLERPFVIVEYLPNTLANEIKKETIGIGKGITYAMQLLSAVKHLSNKSIIHRDIKPENIFINNYSAILGDFGLIKRIETIDPNDREEICGYAAMPFFYRSPDLVSYAKGESNLSIASDIFQLGLVFAHMFTGLNPLKKPENNNVLSNIELFEIQQIKGRYGERIKNIITRMLDIDCNTRITVDRALDDFNGIFESFAQTKIDLDGKLFD